MTQLVDQIGTIVGIIALSAGIWWQFIQPEVVPSRHVRIAAWFGAGMLALSSEAILSGIFARPFQLVGILVLLIGEMWWIWQTWRRYGLRPPTDVIKETLKRWNG